MRTGVSRIVDRTFFKNLVIQQIKQEYLENITGFAWLILQPLILLAVYSFVFSTIFKARIPEAGAIGFVPYLAVAFWPWIAFSEAIVKASTSSSANAALIGKVAFATEQVPLATVTATFLMNMVGYLAVLVVLQLSGTDIHWLYLLAVVPVVVVIWMFACAIALFASAMQVFIRDIAQMLPPLMMFWFFTTPILYSASYLPASVQDIARWNPMAWFVGRLREMLLFGELHLDWVAACIVLFIGVFLWVSMRFFRRFSGHFEDFL